MNKLTQLIIALFVCISQWGIGQVNLSQDFEAGFGTWDNPEGGFDTDANYDCLTSNFAVVNVYDGAVETLQSETQTAQGNSIDVRIKYFIQDFNGLPINYDFGSIKFQYSTDGTTWINLYTVDQTTLAGNSSTCLIYNATIPGASVPAGSDFTFRILSEAQLNEDVVYAFDDILVRETNVCHPVIASSHTNISNSSVAISWASSSIETNATIEYGPAGFTQGSGTIIPTASSPYTLSGLVANTPYQYYIKSVCGANQATWSGPFDMIIAYCTPISNNPSEYIGEFTTTYATTNINYTSPQQNPDGFLDNTTTILAHYEGETFNFSVNYPEYDEFGVKIWIDWNNNSTFEANEIMHFSESFDFTTTGSITIPTGHAVGNYRMRLRVGDDIMFSTSACQDISYGETIDFTFNLIAAPNCIAPANCTNTNSTHNNFTIGWTPAASEIAWNVEYGPKGFTPGSGTTVHVTTNSLTLTTLTSSTEYDFYIQSDCGSGDLSSIRPPFTFRTNLACGDVFTDTGGLGDDYVANENNTWMICASNPSEIIKVEFTAFNTEEDYDSLSIYSNNVLIGSYSGTDLPPVTYSTAGGCLKFVFQSDASYQYEGWAADISCIVCTPGTATGVDGAETMCILDETIDLNTVITPQGPNGTWTSATLNAMITGSVLNFTTVTPGVYEVYYVTAGATVTTCPDTTTATITIVGEANPGIGNTVTSCNYGSVNVADGLTGSHDTGVWYDPQNNVLNNTNISLLGFVPGNYTYTYTVNNGVCPSASAIVNLFITLCVGVEELELEGFSVFPNPTSGAVNLQYNGVNLQTEVSIVDVKGAVVYNGQVAFENGKNISLDLSTFENGMYYVHITSAKNSKSFGVIKK